MSVFYLSVGSAQELAEVGKAKETPATAFPGAICGQLLI